MKPQEKANELIEKAKKATSYQYQEYAGAHYTWFEHDTDTLKLIALITVEEVINGYLEEYGCDRQFWDCVKAELEVLM
jgi:hypothetical protein